MMAMDGGDATRVLEVRRIRLAEPVAAPVSLCRGRVASRLCLLWC
jgi:hypothetical protein